MNKPTRPQPFPSPVQRFADARHKSTPQAPAPYRPQPVPKCLQPKAATPTPPNAGAVNAAPARPSPSASQAKAVSPIQRHVGPPARPSTAPVAPAVYRPQPEPRVLQTKAAAGGHARGVHATPTARPAAVVQRTAVVHGTAAAVAAGARPGFGHGVRSHAPAPLRVGGIIQLAFDPNFYQFGPAVADEMVRPLAWGEVPDATSRDADSGVAEGDVASYAVVQYLERVGDELTGDHQPSGAAVKEALRLALHNAKLSPLTRLQAKNAYKKAITIVVTDAWHKRESRTYGGRNSEAQISADAADLFAAAQKDFDILADHLKTRTNDPLSPQKVDELWDALHEARVEFFKTGKLQPGTLQ